jgi:hypothetical protein
MFLRLWAQALAV